ncbi:MAG: DUF438 domain-containing protein [Anaerolineae bacterium]|jgi:DUF438 domain-containing protein
MSETPQNLTERKQLLKQLILDLHAGGDFDEIKGRFQRLVGDISAVQISELEQELIDEGLPVESVRELCDVHVALFEDALTDRSGHSVPPGHPVHTARYENYALGEVLGMLEDAIAALPADSAWRQVRAFTEQLGQVEKVYLRKENILFPYLEKHGVKGPSSVMWSIHDAVRAQLKQLRAAIQEQDTERVRSVFAPLRDEIAAMFNKEEQVLYPTSLQMLSDGEWKAILEQSASIGYALVLPKGTWDPGVPAEHMTGGAPTGSYQAPGAAEGSAGLLPLDVGALTLEQVNLMLKHLPVDVTFVDEDDTVRYYSQGIEERVFVREPAIIGRKVQNCHPPASIDTVNRLLEAFRRGERDMAEFWIQMGPRFVHIRYFALRDAQGNYRGTIEVTQDAAPIRALEGERRLLDEAM